MQLVDEISNSIRQPLRKVSCSVVQIMHDTTMYNVTVTKGYYMPQLILYAMSVRDCIYNLKLQVHIMILLVLHPLQV